MNTTGRRLIVVLGMHRSGTSTIARALSVLGVSLGDKLMPPAKGNNEKGFFEDIDLNALNVEMLRELDSDWHCLAPFGSNDMETLRRKGYFLHAADLLRQKTADASVFGFKDPRVIKLLPFWHQVFSHCEFDIGYVLVVRNPMSVAQSLTKRDHFDREKGYMLWLGHVLGSLVGTQQHRRVLVDYDCFLSDTQKDLALIAERLALQIEPQALREYLAEFVDPNLRHTIYTLNDLSVDVVCPPLVRELYSALLELVRDNKIIDSLGFRARIAEWADEFNRLKSNLHWIDNLSRQIDGLNDSIAVRDKELIELAKVGLTQDLNFFKKSFDSVSYLEKYPDIAMSGIDPYQHYISAGLLEGRLPSADLVTLVRSGFLDRWQEQTAQVLKAKLLAEHQLLQLSERDKELAQRLQDLQLVHEQQKGMQSLELAKREQAHLAQLALARQQIELRLAELARRERDFSKQLQDLQHVHEQQKNAQSREHAEREQEHLAQLALARQQAEVRLAELAQREKEFSKQLQALQQVHEQQKDVQIREHAGLEQSLRAELALARQHIEAQRLKLLERDEEFARQLKDFQQVHEQQKDAQSLKHAERRQAYLAQLMLARQQIELRLAELAQRERDFSKQMQALQQVHEQQKDAQSRAHAEREQAHVGQLALARQQSERWLVELAQREKDFSRQLQDLQQAHEQQKDAQNRRHEAHLAHLTGDLKSTETHVLELMAREKELGDQFHRELNAIFSTYTWRLTAPLRSLAARLGVSSQNGSKLQPASKKVVDRAETESHVIQTSPTKINRIFEMPLSDASPIAETLEELLSYHDERFIYSAYQTFLGRAPDPDGMQHYLSRVRAGISKLEILLQLHSSAEGKSRKIEIIGLREAVNRRKWQQTPLLGPLLRLFGVSRDRESLQKQLRAIENKLYVNDVRLRTALGNIEISIGSVRKEISGLANNIASHFSSLSASSNSVAHQTHNSRVEGGEQSLPAGPEAQNSPVVFATPIDFYISPEDGKDYNLQQERIRHSDYMNLVKESGLFDSAFYLSNYSIDKMFKDEPVLHYVLFGESNGWQPNPDFWPSAYLKINMDVAAAGLNPFMHFLQTGRYEGRRSRPLPSVEGGIANTPLPTLRGRGFENPQKLAICLHIYYYDLWDELEKTLGLMTHPFDLFIGIVDRGNSPEFLTEKIAITYPSARIFIFPNHGRDIFPFVYMAAAGLFDPYDAVCKIHTKKSPHREDGDVWRNHLINGVLPGKQTEVLLEGFLSDKEIGIVVADGQIFEGDQWWGSNNRTRVPELLHRVEIRRPMDVLRFPAGSIYWLKRPIVNLIRGMQLSETDFEVEDSQVDGTTAHAFERVLGFLSDAASLKIAQTTEILDKISVSRRKSLFDKKRKPFVSCFYLPQFHSIPENDAWWGIGYTEWIGAAKAKPQYSGHYQPVTPVGTGFYDLRVPETIGQQFKLAKSCGIDAFCVYYYWFDHGKRLLEAPLDNLLARPDIDACFYLCWANESWTRNWDGLSGEVLLSQTYLPKCENDIAKDSAKYFSDPRYYRVNGIAPRFVIYRPEDIPDLAGFIEKLRGAWSKLGFAEVNLGAVLFHLNSEVDDEMAHLFDFFIEMPPHGLVASDGYIVGGDHGDPNFPVSANFKGLIYSYDKLIEKSIHREFPDSIKSKVVRGLMPSWDNTARRGNRAHICFGANPARFGYWMDGLLKANDGSGELMINSWNEWGEKAMIEASCQYGSGYLSALKTRLLS